MWSRVLRKFDHMIRLLERMVELQQEEVKMSAETDAAVKAMTDQLTATKSAVDNVVLLLTNLPPPGDPGVPAAQVQAFADTLKANVQPLLDAVAPKPAPTPVPAPPPPPVSSAPPPPPSSVPPAPPPPPPSA